MRVVLGNRDAVHSTNNGETRARLPKGKRATEFVFDDGVSLLEAFQTITNPLGGWQAHASELDGLGRSGDVGTPAWVAVDKEHETLGRMLAEQYGGVEVRELLDPYDPDTPKAKTSVLVAAVSAHLTLMSLLFTFTRLLFLLKTNAGNDFQAAQMGGSASATAVAKYVGLTANTTAPAATDTTLTAEIATAGGGLIRKAGTYGHTTGAASYTITTVFTANGSDSLPVTVGKRGIFDAVTAGNLVFSTLVSPTATLSASGDQLTITDTISL